MCLGIPGQIEEIIDASTNMAMVNVSGVRRAVNIAFIIGKDRSAAACVGDWVLVHVGFAMIRVDEQEAAATLAILKEMDEYHSDMEALKMSVAEKERS